MDGGWYLRELFQLSIQLQRDPAGIQQKASTVCLVCIEFIHVHVVYVDPEDV